MTNTESRISSMPADREPLYLMTKLKLDRFKQRKIKFEEQYSEIMKQANDENITLADKLEIFRQGIQKLFPYEGKDRYLTDFTELLAIANASTSTSDSLLENFCQRLRKIIEGGKRRSQYNYLFGLIMSQWFSRQEDKVTPVNEELTSTDYLITNERLETIIFDQPSLDFDNWRNFLQKNLFANFNDNQKLKEAFEELKNSTNHYSHSLLTEKVRSEDVKTAMRSLISGGLLNEHRKRLMEKMRSDENAVAELASSLTLMISDLSEWNWPSEGVRGIFRRNLTGKYRCFYEEDFLTAIFLQHLGLKWTYHFKQQLRSLFDLLTKDTQHNSLPESIQCKRIEMQRNYFWMASLPDETNVTVPYIDSDTNSVSLC